MLDINGNEFKVGTGAFLLCEVVEIREDGIMVRIMNSDTHYLVNAKHDEVFGGLVADSELTAFNELEKTDAG